MTLDIVAAHFQLGVVARLAQRFPAAVIVVNHFGPPTDFGDPPRPEAELIAAWRREIERLAPHPNVHLKLGGMGSHVTSHSLPTFNSLPEGPTPPTSERLAQLYRPLVRHAIETLGPSRCMFESNFPVDKAIASYRVLERLQAPGRAIFRDRAAGPSFRDSRARLSPEPAVVKDRLFQRWGWGG